MTSLATIIVLLQMVLGLLSSPSIASNPNLKQAAFGFADEAITLAGQALASSTPSTTTPNYGDLNATSSPNDNPYTILQTSTPPSAPFVINPTPVENTPQVLGDTEPTSTPVVKTKYSLFGQGSGNAATFEPNGFQGDNSSDTYFEFGISAPNHELPTEVILTITGPYSNGIPSVPLSSSATTTYSMNIVSGTGVAQLNLVDSVAGLVPGNYYRYTAHAETSDYYDDTPPSVFIVPSP